MMQSVTQGRTRSLLGAVASVAFLTGIVAVSAAWTGQEMTQSQTVDVVIEGSQVTAPDSVAAGQVSFRVQNNTDQPVSLQVQSSRGEAALTIEQVGPEGTKTGEAELQAGQYRLMALSAEGQPVGTSNLRVYEAAGSR